MSSIFKESKSKIFRKAPVEKPKLLVKRRAIKKERYKARRKLADVQPIKSDKGM